MVVTTCYLIRPSLIGKLILIMHKHVCFSACCFMILSCILLYFLNYTVHSKLKISEKLRVNLLYSSGYLLFLDLIQSYLELYNLHFM